MDVVIMVFGKVLREVLQNTSQGHQLLANRLIGTLDWLHKHLGPIRQLRLRRQDHGPLRDGTSICHV
jgi:hypothetical protein